MQNVATQRVKSNTMRASDLEGGRTPPFRRRKKRTSWRTPLSITFVSFGHNSNYLMMRSLSFPQQLFFLPLYLLKSLNSFQFFSLQSTLLIFTFFLVLGIKRSGVAGLATAAKKSNIGQPTLYTYEVIAEFPHDVEAFTQGLEYDERCTEGGPCRPIFWESTGLNGRSTVREVEVTTGKVLRSRDLPKSHFGEGLTRLGDRLYQVMWQTNKGWSYNVDNFNDAKEIKV